MTQQEVHDLWREVWNQRDLVTNFVTEGAARNYAKNNAHKHDRELKVDWHPKDGFVVYMDREVHPLVGKEVVFTGEGGGFLNFRKGDKATIESIEVTNSDTWAHVVNGEHKTVALMGLEVRLAAEGGDGE